MFSFVSDPSPNSVNVLKAIQMITISAILGIGFYVRIGTVLRTAGPLALVLSFTLLTLFAWAVMQCITEMLSIWPVPGALVEFVGCFVDEDFGYTIGVAYWSVPSKRSYVHHGRYSGSKSGSQAARITIDTL